MNRSVQSQRDRGWGLEEQRWRKKRLSADRGLSKANSVLPSNKKLFGKLTIMVIPHSDQKVKNFRIPSLFLFGLLLLLIFGLAYFLYNTTVFSLNRKQIVKANRAVEYSEKNLDSLLGDIDDLQRTYQQWEQQLNSTLLELGLAPEARKELYASEGDLASLDNVQELGRDEIRQIHDVKQLSDSLYGTISSLMEIARVLKSQKKFLSDYPNLWPVSGGVSSVSMGFGFAKQPVTGRWFVHRGIDITGLPGMQIVASANGDVVEAGYDTEEDDGAYVVIKHKYGIQTRYSHLGTLMVKPGDKVAQGQSLGTLGLSGLSVYPHVEFQIIIGTQALDPTSYLKMSGNNTILGN